MTAKRMALYLGSQKVSAHIGSQKVTPATQSNSQIDIYVYVDDPEHNTQCVCEYTFDSSGGASSTSITIPRNQNALITTINSADTLYHLSIDTYLYESLMFKYLYVSNDGTSWTKLGSCWEEQGNSEGIGIYGAFRTYEVTQTTYFKFSNT